MSNLCIIPARGGSKRIPRKNIKDFLGKPIIAYSIEVALKSGLFEEVMVSTDDEEIAEIAIKFGAKVPFRRSTENASDNATTMEVIFEVLDYYNKIGKTFTNTCCIYPTAPLINEANLQKAYYLLRKEKFDTVFPVTTFSFPIQRALRLDEKNKVRMIWPENINTRSQDLPHSYHDSGQFYWLNGSSLTRDSKLYSENSGFILLNNLEVQDIDNLEDWYLAILKYQLNVQ